MTSGGLSLSSWISSEDIEAAKSVIADCPREVLEMVAALINLDISTRDFAGNLAADGWVFRSEEATHRANLYRASIDALVEVWGPSEEESDDE